MRISHSLLALAEFRVLERKNLEIDNEDALTKPEINSRRKQPLADLHLCNGKVLKKKRASSLESIRKRFYPFGAKRLDRSDGCSF